MPRATIIAWVATVEGHMRNAFVLATACLICLGQPGLAASGTIKLSKPNTSYSSFMDDRATCLRGS